VILTEGSVTVAEVSSAILLIAGVVVLVLAAIGVAVMRNAYDRLHFVSFAGFGALLVGTSVIAREGFSLIGDKALATGVLLVCLSPIVVHTTLRSLRTRELGAWNAEIEEVDQQGAQP
jgi:multisubunit Na+/H+ antiporter MnhG subunit